MEEFATSETALVAYLALQRIRPHRSEIRDGWCYWIFPDTSALQRRVVEYDTRIARVEPSSFMREFTHLKRHALDMRAAQPA